jgi:hypothetical protein
MCALCHLSARRGGQTTRQRGSLGRTRSRGARSVCTTLASRIHPGHHAGDDPRPRIEDGPRRGGCVTRRGQWRPWQRDLLPLRRLVSGREDTLSCDRTLCHYVCHRSVSPPAVCMQGRKRVTELLQAYGMILASALAYQHQQILCTRSGTPHRPYSGSDCAPGPAGRCRE